MALTFDQVRDAALGRWRECIFPAFGIEVPRNKNTHGPCPVCGGKDRFRFDDQQGKGTWICNQCNAGDGFSLVEKARGLNYSEVLKEVGAVLGLSSESKVTDEDRKKWREKSEQLQRDQEQKEEKERLAAAKRAKRVWSYKSVDRDCPYLERKHVKNHGCKINGKGNLLIPLFDIENVIWNIQEIHADGFKPYLPGGRINDCFFLIGQITASNQIICFVEGYATGASVYEATGHTTVVTFQSSNIDKVAKVFRQKYPDARFVFCADDDSYSNPPDAGLKAANKALAATGGIVILPVFKTVEPV